MTALPPSDPPPSAPQIRWLYLTAKDTADALRMGRALVEERLAACVNVLGPITSIYRWEGKVHEDPEVAWIAKTTEALVDPLTARVRELHPYDCPCVVALPVTGGLPAFAAWVRDQVGT